MIFDSRLPGSASQRRATAIGTAVLIYLVTLSAAVQSQVNLPPVNLGGSSFMDGVAGPGWLFQETVILYDATDFTDSEGSNIPGDNEVDSIVALTQFSLVTEKQLFGGFYGAEVLLPIVDVDVDTGFGPNGSSTGIGDLIISPFIIQWMHGKLFDKPYWHRLNFDFMLPTGKYDSDKSVNIGSNVWSFNPYYAFTLEVSPKFEISGRLHYLWNSENDDPSPRLAADDTQPGQAFHMNYSASYEFMPGWRAGLAGYYLKQLTDHQIDNRDIANSKEQVFAIGPGVSYAAKGQFFNLNAYFESNAENRTEGTNITLRYSKVF
jgi:hypothetical protein